MRVVVIGLNYPPEVAGIAPQTAALCRYLTARGDAVYMLTARPHYPAWRVRQGYSRGAFTREVEHGVQVIRLASYVPRNPGSLMRRMLYDGSFALTASLAALVMPRADVYLYVGAQPAVALATALVARVRRRPWVAKVADLAVNAGAAVGIIRHPMLVRLLQFVEYAIYERANAVLVLSEGFAAELSRHRLSRGKLHIVHDSEDLGTFTSSTNRADTRRRHGLDPDRPLITHIGSIGRKQGLQVAVRAASQDQSGACWLFVGDGPAKPKLQRSAPAYQTCFLPFLARPELADLLAASDLALLTQRRLVVESVIPSKLITYMAAGLPVVASVHARSEAARLIRKAECGLVVEPESPGALRDAVAELLADAARREQLAASARAFAEREFDRWTVVARQASILESLTRRRGRSERQA